MIRTANLTLSVSRNAGGLFESVRRLVQSLMQSGMDVRVFGLHDKFTVADLPAWAPVPVMAFKPTWPETFGYSPQFLEELINFEPDITHTHGIWVYTSIATNHYCRKMRAPYLISAHGMLDHWAVQNSRWKKAVAHFLYEGAHLRGAHCLRALCDAEARAIRDLGLANDIAVIPNGIDMPEFSPGGVEPGTPPWDGFVERGQKVLLYLGRVHPKKGIVNLIRAWAAVHQSEVRSQNSGWMLAIAGWDQGGHEYELKRLCDELEVAFADIRSPAASLRPPPSVLFLGPQFDDAKTLCYRHCGAFVLPSFSEGVPMTVLEAWVHSKPVLMTPQCNLPEGFAAGAALKMDPSVESITNALNKMFRMTNVELAIMGSRGHALAAERFAWPRIAKQMTTLYEWILGGGSRPACVVDY